MRTGAPAGHRGYFHEAAFYNSDEQFVTVAAPFLEEGVAAGEPTLVALDEASSELVRTAVGDSAGLVYLDSSPGRRRHGRPAEAIASYREIFAGYVADGVPQIRVLGEIPHPGFGRPWDGWARYEATVNHAFAEFPVWGLCPYDIRAAPAAVLADAERTHPQLVTTAGEHLSNPRYQDPAQFLTERPPPAADPLEAATPAIELTDPAPAAARDAVRATGHATALDPAEIDDLVMAVSEAVTNALYHGRPPVRLRVWTARDRIVAAVRDHGPGVSDPFAGLLPATATSAGGMGLWVIHHSCSMVTLHRDQEGFTIRLVAGTPATETERHAGHHE